MNNTANYELTIVVPIYNEADNMSRLVKTVGDFLPTCTKKACVLFVNDGSDDGSLALIKEACAANGDFYYISWNRNRGLSAAIKAGIDVSESALTGYMDADMQTDVRDFNLLLEHAD